MTFLTYEDSIEIGIGVDSVLMEHGDDLEFILDNFHASIKHMDEYTSQNEVGPVK